MGAFIRFELFGSPSEPVVRVVGEFDLDAEEAFGILLDAILDEARVVTIDLRPTTFIDVRGVHSLFYAHQVLEEAGVKMRLIRGPDTIQRIFILMGITNTFDYVDG
jgi:anti-anti-sigma factor